MTLLLDHWFGISPAFSGFVMNVLCYCLGWKLMGKEFLGYSIVATASFSISYRIYEQFPYIWPQLAQMPLLASVLGAVFVGVGAGLCVRIGGAPGGDDALAMSISYVTKMEDPVGISVDRCNCSWIIVKLYSSKKIGYSILTVLLSGADHRAGTEGAYAPDGCRFSCE